MNLITILYRMFIILRCGSKISKVETSLQPSPHYLCSQHQCFIDQRIFAFESDLTPVQCFLDRCFKRNYTSKPVSVYDFLERQDRKIFKKVSNAKGHPLLSIMPCVKPSSYNLRKETCFKPKINTMRFKNSFINRLVFKYE